MPLPIRKGEQVAHTITQYNTPGYLRTDFNYRTDLKWWFETLGVVPSTLAVSDVAFAGSVITIPGCCFQLSCLRSRSRLRRNDW